LANRRAPWSLPRPNPLALEYRDQFLSFAQKSRLLSMYAQEEFVQAGGLMSYQSLLNRADEVIQ
jgi:hypothetical protein